MSTPFNPGDPHSAAQPPTTLPAEPTDVITTVAKTAVDPARLIVAQLGLRKYQVYLVTITYQGPRFGEGNATSVVFDELVPTPKVKGLSERRIVGSGGVYKDGALAVSKITVTRRKEQLEGKAQLGADPSSLTRSLWGVQPKGQLFMELYELAGDPALETFGWSVILNPLSMQAKGVGVT
jgi:hypothetical protein